MGGWWGRPAAAARTMQAIRASREWLPGGRASPFARSETCCECSLPAEVLARIARKEGWTLEPKSDVAVSLRAVLGLPALKKMDFGDIDLVAEALVYQNRKPNGGGVTVVYDTEASRLFVHESHR